MGFQVALVVKNPPSSAGDRRDTGSVLGVRQSSGGGHGNPFRILAWRVPWIEDPAFTVPCIYLSPLSFTRYFYFSFFPLC